MVTRGRFRIQFLGFVSMGPGTGFSESASAEYGMSTRNSNDLNPDCHFPLDLFQER
jgi:hypothetical protein